MKPNISCKAVEKRAGSLQRTLSLVGDKWSLLMIGYMMKGPVTFSELEKSLVGISPRTLSERLDDLEQYGVVKRRLYTDKPARYLYDLTPKGQGLRPALIELASW
ncbi:MAG: DNA-binding HxlR family transcriptional regulator [Candidatus Saccharimonadales bacterium]|jgi:DNA-binding HxlR family transcriptional regulator